MPVRGGDRLKAHFAKARNRQDRARSLSVGFIDPGARYPDGTSLGFIARFMEFGSIRRPFLRPAWKAFLPIARRFVRSRLDPVSGTISKSDARTLGQDAVESVQYAIRAQNEPRSAPATLRRRRALGPLRSLPAV